MEIQYYKEYSSVLGRDMEFKIYGHGGKPAIFIPCQDGRFFDFENYKMIDVWAPWIESGKVMVFSIDTIDKETWSNQSGDAYWRIRRHEQWMQYITEEMVPRIQAIANERNGWDGVPGIMAFGCSLGATHAANLYLRYPNLFDRLLALSGIYTSNYGFGDYMDEVVYRNSPEHYMENLPSDHPFIQQYNSKKAVLCVGLGPWELPDSTRHMDNIFRAKGINAWVDYWGYDCEHDWNWWYKQVVYFLPYLLDEQ